MKVSVKAAIITIGIHFSSKNYRLLIYQPNYLEKICRGTVAPIFCMVKFSVERKVQVHYKQDSLDFSFQTNSSEFFTM